MANPDITTSNPKSCGEPGHVDEKLTPILRALKDARLEPHHIALLRESIAHIAQASAGLSMQPAPFPKRALASLKVADTQLRDLATRMKGHPLDAQSLASLPAHLKARIEGRLEGQVKKLAQPAPQQPSPQPYGDAGFRCLTDYEACRAANRQAPIWCHISLIVCLIRALLAAEPRASK